ncbi:hypothetical protein MPSD_20970 [Mycobacterium pseudoshottsii JCM 15466]|uniref:O-phosphotransferase n=1 Tax=Mycobacterium pseudoshottsii TaxID=265949 RepID=A0A9N7QNH1_9MYCO|nr:hypothetical protein MMSP_4109 [Mycobacterium sp. 012931]MBC9860589.1 putative O-phosphotransferase [Mycobacterium pseudoshottsii]RFZ60507.1 Chloramphenicol 3-O phosphotransferase [Mycobacterium marinum]BBA87664.1 hypothetical protein MPSD_20970 [Mycobacterium pseudoshottsii JCM 15466]BDN81850.1 hypothetical protein NJB1907Z4_C20650 [Mycobacterium pseudoshottsii]
MTEMAKGKLILLNGGSSAGKTSLALAFQDLAAECWMHLGIDVFWKALPPKQHDLARVWPQYYTWESVVEADGLDWFTVHPGPILDQAMHARYHAIRAYLDNGMNVVADDVIWKREWLIDTLQIFEGAQVWMVGVHVSDEEGARREEERGDRYAGWNRGSARCPPRCRVRLRTRYHREPGSGAGARTLRVLPGLPATHGFRPIAQALPALSRSLNLAGRR